MTRLGSISALVLLLAAPAVQAQVVDPREQSYQFFVDGVLTVGVIGYKLDFNHDPLLRSDARRLDVAFSPDVRRLSITVTQKGLNRLQVWLNSATLTGNPPSKSVALVVRMGDGTILARWELTGVIPATFISTATGPVTEITATVEFIYDTLNLVQAKPD